MLRLYCDIFIYFIIIVIIIIIIIIIIYLVRRLKFTNRGQRLMWSYIADHVKHAYLTKLNV